MNADAFMQKGYRVSSPALKDAGNGDAAFSVPAGKPVCRCHIRVNSSFVTPDDFKELAVPVLGHRLIIRGALKSRQTQIKEIIENILNETAVPTEEWSAPNV